MCISILNIFISTRHVVTSTILLVCRGQWIHEIMGGFFQTMKCDYFVKFLYCCDVQQNQMIFYNKKNRPEVGPNDAILLSRIICIYRTRVNAAPLLNRAPGNVKSDFFLNKPPLFAQKVHFLRDF